MIIVIPELLHKVRLMFVSCSRFVVRKPESFCYFPLFQQRYGLRTYSTGTVDWYIPLHSVLAHILYVSGSQTSPNNNAREMERGRHFCVNFIFFNFYVSINQSLGSDLTTLSFSHFYFPLWLDMKSWYVIILTIQWPMDLKPPSMEHETDETKQWLLFFYRKDYFEH